MVLGSLAELLERTVGGLGYRLSDFEYVNHGRMLRVFIERLHEVLPGTEAGGIGLADCESVSRQLQRVLEVEGVEYERLEVSSPGLDRKLKGVADFARFAGRRAQVRLRSPVNGRRNFVGTLCAVEGDRIGLDFEGGHLDFKLDDVERARLVPKL